MLDSKILDFARRLIQADIKKRQRSFFDELSRKKRELQLSGNSPGTSSSGKKIIRNIFTKELESRAHVAWKSLQRAHKAVGSQPTETLAYDFKEAVAHFLDEITKELSEFMMKRPYFAKDDTANSSIYSAKNDVSEEINVEIDLYVNTLTQSSSGQKKAAETVFISHAAEDRVLAQSIKEEIEKVFENRIEVFVSSIEGTIPPGSEWLDNIIKNLKVTDSFLVLFTPVSKERRFVWFEIGFSWLRKLEEKCEIYVLFAPPIRAGDLPNPLDRLQGTSLGKQEEVKVFFKRLIDQFGFGRMEAFDFSRIQQLLPEYKDENTEPTGEKIRGEVICNEINKLLMNGTWYRADLLISHLSQSFPKESIVERLSKMEKDGRVTWGDGPMKDDSKVKLVKVK